MSLNKATVPMFWILQTHYVNLHALVRTNALKYKNMELAYNNTDCTCIM